MARVNKKILGVCLGLFVAGMLLISTRLNKGTSNSQVAIDPAKIKSDEEWKKILTPEQYRILRQAGTETPFTGELEHESRKGTFYSVGCNEPIFRSEQKFDSGTGWPSF